MWPLPYAAKIESPHGLKERRSFVFHRIGDLACPSLKRTLECRDISQVQTAGDQQGSERECYRDSQKNPPGCRSGDDNGQRDQHAADDITDAGGADVDEELGAPLLPRRHGSVQELVRGSEERASKHHFGPSSEKHWYEAGDQEGAHGSHRD